MIKQIPDPAAADRTSPLSSGCTERAPSGVPNGAPDDGCLVNKRDINPNKLTVIGLLLLAAAVIFPIVKIFFVPVVVAAALATLFFPLYSRIRTVFGNKRGLSSFICCLLIFLCLVTPTYLMVQLVVKQAVELYQSAEPVVKDIIDKGNNSDFLSQIQNLPFVHKLQRSNAAITVPLQEAIKTLLSVGTKAINKTSTGLFEFVITIFVMFFTLFYFFRDGESLVKRIKYLVPIRSDYEELIIRRFLLISRATVLMTAIIGTTQGTIGALALLIFGVKLWLLWGFIMIVLSLIPLMGAWMVLIPAGIIQLIMGHTGQGIGIILTSLMFVSTVDNFLRPRLVGRGAKLHDLVIFFSSLGGIAVFGPLGFIVGPVIAALFVAVLDIYGMEFERQLKGE
jgi:predicted PurR-regulated permease PerM